MSKCRFDLSEDCNNTDCLNCVLEKIIDEVCDIDDEIVLNPDSLYNRKAYVRFNKVIDIIDKYKAESEELKEENIQCRCNSCQNNTDELSGECYECVKGIEDWYEPISELRGEQE